MEDGGRNLLRAKGLFRNLTREGVSAYVSRWITDGWLRLDLGGERRSPVGNSSSHGGLAMAHGKEHAGEHGSVATGHGLKNRGHRESEGVKGTSDRPIRWPEYAASEVAAMAGSESSMAHSKTVIQTMKIENNGMGR